LHPAAATEVPCRSARRLVVVAPFLVVSCTAALYGLGQVGLSTQLYKVEPSSCAQAAVGAVVPLTDDDRSPSTAYDGSGSQFWWLADDLNEPSGSAFIVQSINDGSVVATVPIRDPIYDLAFLSVGGSTVLAASLQLDDFSQVITVDMNSGNFTALVNSTANINAAVWASSGSTYIWTNDTNGQALFLLDVSSNSMSTLQLSQPVYGLSPTSSGDYVALSQIPNNEHGAWWLVSVSGSGGQVTNRLKIDDSGYWENAWAYDDASSRFYVYLEAGDDSGAFYLYEVDTSGSPSVLSRSSCGGSLVTIFNA